MNKEFLEESMEWMNSINYSLYHTINKNSICSFESRTNDETYPIITCFQTDEGEKRCYIHDNKSYEKYLQLQSTELQFRLPNIAEYIELFRYYSKLVSGVK